MSICPVDENGYCGRHKCRHRGRILQIALTDDDKSESFRQTWDKQLVDRENGRKPSIVVKGLKYLVSLGNHYLKGRPVVSLEVYQEREAHCNACEHVDKTSLPWTCNLCGCLLQQLENKAGKLHWAGESCPDSPPRWSSVAQERKSGCRGCNKQK